ncbi:MAG TPA: hypothetical protein VGL93_14685 [Streptosporangiaceae bacterium]|jgi:hypothetical protein
MKRPPTTLVSAAVLATAATGCGPGTGSRHIQVRTTICGTTLYTGVEARAAWPLRPAAGSGRGPARSVLPAASPTPPPGTGLEMVRTGGCADAPVVTVRPARAARTLVVVHGANGGVAGLALATYGRTLTVRAYTGGRLTGELTLPRGGDPRPRVSAS